MTAEVEDTAGFTNSTASAAKNNIKPSSTLRVEPATVSDIEDITDIWYAAFGSGLGDIFPDTPGVRQWWNDTNRHDLLRKPFQQYLKVVDTAAGGKLIAYAKWDFSTATERGSRFPPWHEEINGEQASRFFDALEDERKRLLGDNRNYYLDMLATHPEHEKRGAGSMLVQWGCDLADENGVAAYIDASKAGAPLYKKFGFEDRSQPGLGFPGVSSMVRNARLPKLDEKLG